MIRAFRFIAVSITIILGSHYFNCVFVTVGAGALLPVTEEGLPVSLRYISSPVWSKRPEGMSIIAWIRDWEGNRDRAWYQSDSVSLENFTREISDAIGRIPNLAMEEGLDRIVLTSILKTRRFYPGHVNTAQDLYGITIDTLQERLQNPNSPLSIILIEDSLSRLSIVRESISDQLQAVPIGAGELRELQQTVIEDLTTSNAIIFPPGEEGVPLRNALQSVMQLDLMRRIAGVVRLGAPQISLRQAFEELMGAGDEGYRGWEVVGLDACHGWLAAQGGLDPCVGENVGFMLKPLFVLGMIVDEPARARYPLLSDRVGENHVFIPYIFQHRTAAGSLGFLLVRKVEPNEIVFPPIF